MVSVMSTTRLKTGDAPLPETEIARRRRIAWEAEMIAEARADIAAGLYVDSDDIDAWIDSIGTDHELPPPPTRQR
jgi:predicted transcriptional regulator